MLVVWMLRINKMLINCRVLFFDRGGVIVTLPQKVSLDDASRGLEMFQKLQVPVLGIVENMSYLELPDGTIMDIFGSGGGKALAEHTGVPFLGAIPIDPKVREGGDEGVPIVVSNPESPVAKAFVQLAEKLASQLSINALAGKGPSKVELEIK